MDADDVGVRDDFLRAAQHLDAPLLDRPARRKSALLGEAPAPDQDRHAERARAARHFLPDVAEADQPQRAAEQPLRLGKLLLVPLARA